MNANELNTMFEELKLNKIDPLYKGEYLRAALQFIAEGKWTHPDGPVEVAKNVLANKAPY